MKKKTPGGIVNLFYREGNWGLERGNSLLEVFVVSTKPLALLRPQGLYCPSLWPLYSLEASCFLQHTGPATPPFSIRWGGSSWEHLLWLPALLTVVFSVTWTISFKDGLSPPVPVNWVSLAVAISENRCAEDKKVLCKDNRSLVATVYGVLYISVFKIYFVCMRCTHTMV